MPRGQPGVPVTLRESQLLSEYLASRWSGHRIILQPRLGLPAPQGDNGTANAAELRMLGIWRRYPDAVVLDSHLVTIVEACLKPDPGKISLIELYRDLFPKTPEMEEFRLLPIDMLLVWAVPDEALATMARAHGIKVEVFQPQWVIDWLDTLAFRKRRAATVAV